MSKNGRYHFKTAYVLEIKRRDIYGPLMKRRAREKFREGRRGGGGGGGGGVDGGIFPQ